MGIAQRIDKLPMTKGMWRILLLVGIGWLFDAMDQGMVSGVIAAIGNDPDWALSTAQRGWLGSAGTLGMIFGALLSGIAADRWGRRTVITVTLLIFSLGSAACGLAVNYQMLLICRFITGFGLGGELPAASTLVSEFSPVKQRGRNVVILESFWAWGWIAAALVAYLVIPVLGWRVAFFIGAVPALFAAILRFAVPESPRYLEQRGRLEEAEALVSKLESEAGVKAGAQPATGGSSGGSGSTASNSASRTSSASTGSASSAISTSSNSNSTNSSTLLNQDAPAKKPLSAVRVTFVLWVLWFGVNLGYYGFVLWTPSLLSEQGLALTKSFQYTLIMCIAQLPGYLVAALLIDIVGRKPVLTVFLAGTAASALLFGYADSSLQILVAGCLLYFFALGTWGCVYSYTPELYATAVRGLGVGSAAAVGRIGAFIAPMIVPVLYNHFGAETGFAAVFFTLTIVFALVALVVGIFGIETRGRELE